MMVMADGSTSSTSEPNFSDSEKEVVSGRGRGRGRGRSRQCGGFVANTNKKQNQKASCQNTVASGQNTVARMQLPSEGESAETSDTDETKRIQAAVSRLVLQSKHSLQVRLKNLQAMHLLLTLSWPSCWECCSTTASEMMPTVSGPTMNQ